MNNQNKKYELQNNKNIVFNSNLRASIGNNINNEMLIQNKNQSENVQKELLGNIEFNNIMKRFNAINNLQSENYNNLSKNSQKNIFNNNSCYRKVNLVNDMKGNTNKDYIAYNNNILDNSYQNINNINNINSSFYKNLQNNFTSNINIPNMANIFYNRDMHKKTNTYFRKNIRNIDNDCSSQPYIFTQHNINAVSFSVYARMHKIGQC